MHVGLPPKTHGSGVSPSLFSVEQLHSISTSCSLPGGVSSRISWNAQCSLIALSIGSHGSVLPAASPYDFVLLHLRSFSVSSAFIVSASILNVPVHVFAHVVTSCVEYVLSRLCSLYVPLSLTTSFVPTNVTSMRTSSLRSIAPPWFAMWVVSARIQCIECLSAAASAGMQSR